MAVTAAIPLPSSGLDSLDQSMAGSQNLINSIIQNRYQAQSQPYDLALKQAAAQQATAKAAQANMIARLIQQVTGMQPGGMPSNAPMQMGNQPSPAPAPTPDLNQQANNFFATAKPGDSYTLPAAPSAPLVNRSAKFPTNPDVANVYGGGNAPSAAPSPQQAQPDSRAADLLQGLLGIKGSPDKVVQGNLIHRNAFTGVSSTPVGQNPTQLAEGKSQVMEAAKLREAATSARNSINLYKQLSDLFEKNPSLTGYGPALATKFKASTSPELGKFTVLAAKAQAELAKLAGQRGGIGVVNWAAQAKPNIWNSGDFNKGMIDSTLNSLMQEYHNINGEHYAVAKKQLPIDFAGRPVKDDRVSPFAQRDQILAQAQDAIQRGAKPDAVQRRLRDQYGIGL